MAITTNVMLDAKDLACPMPIVKTKKAMATMDAGQVIEVQATDKGSTADIKAWADSTGHQYLGTVERENVLNHYVRKASDSELRDDIIKHKDVINLDELRNKLEGDESVTILDVREPAEFAFGHIPGAVNIPLGELEERFSEIEKDKELHVICRTGNRSDLVAQKLAEKGCKRVKNVVPGMSEWNGPINTNN